MAENALKDGNFVSSLILESSTNPGVTVRAKGDELTGRLLVDNASSAGTVTSVSVVSANGFAGTVATATTTPAITLSTTLNTPVIAGNGTAIIAATTTGSGSTVVLNTAPTFATSITGSYLTASEILITNGSKQIVSAAVATYPSLTELTYVKGVTSAIQTQLNAKQASITGSDTQVLFFDGANNPAGDADFAWNKTNNRLLIGSTGGLGGDIEFTGTGYIYTADAPTNSTSREIQIYTGIGNAAGNGGLLALYTGQGGATGSGGAFEIICGNGGGTSGAGGSITITAGNGTAGNGNGGNIDIHAGAPHGSGTVGYLDLRDGAGNGFYSDVSGVFLDSATSLYYFDNGASPNAILDTTAIASTNKTFTFPNLSGTFAVTGASQAVSFAATTVSSLLASANDSGALGASGTAFSDLFLASGGVINFNAGNVTLTHSAGILTQNAGELRITSANVGTNADSVPTLSSTSTFTNKTLTSPTITTGSYSGAQTLQENASIALDPAGSADGKYTGITVTGVAGYAQTYGDLVYLAVADSRWELADADAAATAGPVMLAMVVVAGGSDGAACTLLLQGIIRADAKFPTMTVGATQYVGETAGAIQGAIPTGADNIIRTVGYAMTADELYFNPSTDWQVTVA